MTTNEAERNAREPETATLPAAGRRAARLQGLLRTVNRKIARSAGTNTTAAFVCECLDRSCADAVEAPLLVFDVVATAGRYFLVVPGHDEPPAERVVRRERGYVVVERL